MALAVRLIASDEAVTRLPEMLPIKAMKANIRAAIIKVKFDLRLIYALLSSCTFSIKLMRRKVRKHLGRQLIRGRLA